MTIKPMNYWTETHDPEAKKRGWSLFDAEGTVSVQKIDEPEGGDAELDSDVEAINAVVAGAKRGDEASLVALYLEGRPVDAETYLPRGLRPLNNHAHVVRG